MMVSEKLKSTRLLAIFLAIALSVMALSSYLSNLEKRIAVFGVDEYHTINSSLDRYYGFENTWLRVGEAGRLFGFMFLPGAQYHMNKNMGGMAHITTWWYPGGHYLKKNFTRTNPPAAKKLHARDPNIQDYVHALRVQQVIVLLTSFILAGVSLSLAFGYQAGLVYASLTLMSHTIFKEAAYFYNDTHLTIAFNLIISALFWPKIGSLHRAVWLVPLFSLGVSAKISMIAIAPLVWLKVIDDWLSAKKGYILEYVLFTAVAAIVIFFMLAATAPSFSGLIDQQITNFWHYETGHRIFEPSGWFQVKQILTHFNPVIGAVGVTSIALLAKYPSLIDRYIVACWAIVLFLFLNLQGLHFFLDRNIIILELMFSVVAAIAISKVVSAHLPNYKNAMSMFAVSLSIIILGMRYEPFNIASFEQRASSCERALNITEVKGNALNGEFFVFPDAPFNLRKLLPEWTEKMASYDCVYVHRSGEAKQFSNWILPQTHSLVARHGSHFLYVLR